MTCRARTVPYLLERRVRLHESVGVSAADVDANQLPRKDVAGTIKPADIRVARGGQSSVRTLAAAAAAAVATVAAAASVAGASAARSNGWTPNETFIALPVSQLSIDAPLPGSSCQLHTDGLRVSLLLKRTFLHCEMVLLPRLSVPRRSREGPTKNAPKIFTNAGARPYWR